MLLCLSGCSKFEAVDHKPTVQTGDSPVPALEQDEISVSDESESGSFLLLLSN